MNLQNMGTNLDCCSRCNYFFVHKLLNHIYFSCGFKNKHTVDYIAVFEKQEQKLIFDTTFEFPTNCPFSLEQMISTEEDNQQALRSFELNGVPKEWKQEL